MACGCLSACLHASAVSLPLSMFLPSLRTGTGSPFSSGWLSWSCSCGSARLETQTRPMNIPHVDVCCGHIGFYLTLHGQQHSKHLLHHGETHRCFSEWPLKTVSVRRKNTTHVGKRVWYCLFRVLNVATPNS